MKAVADMTDAEILAAAGPYGPGVVGQDLFDAAQAIRARPGEGRFGPALLGGTPDADAAVEQAHAEASAAHADAAGARAEAERLAAENAALRAELAALQGAPPAPPVAPVADAVDEALPEHFPARALLASAGFDTLGSVRAASDQALLDVKGIGPALLAHIRAA